MFNPKNLFKNDAPTLDKEIERLLADLEVAKPETADYQNIADQLVKLYKLRADIKSSKFRVSGDAIVQASAGLLGILLILKFEKVDIITTKAMGFVKKS